VLRTDQVLLEELAEVFYFTAVALTKLSLLCFCGGIFLCEDSVNLSTCLSQSHQHMGLLSGLPGFSTVCQYPTFGEAGTENMGESVSSSTSLEIDIALDLVMISVSSLELLNLSMSTKKIIWIILMFGVRTL
jgi:hypothetical protein